MSEPEPKPLPDNEPVPTDILTDEEKRLIKEMEEEAK